MGGISISALATERGNWVVLAPYWGLHGVAGQVPDPLRRLASQEMPARHEQIGQRAGDEQAMSVLLQPAIAHLGKAEHPLDDPDRMFDPGPHFGLGTTFLPLDLFCDNLRAYLDGRPLRNVIDWERGAIAQRSPRSPGTAALSRVMICRRATSRICSSVLHSHAL